MACNCYHPERNFLGKVGVCWGTKEREACSCGGDESKCDFYKDKRKKATLKTTNGDYRGRGGREMSETTFSSTTGGNSLVIQPGCPYRLPCGYCKELYLPCINPDYCNTPEWRYNEVTCVAREEGGK